MRQPTHTISRRGLLVTGAGVAAASALASSSALAGLTRHLDGRPSRPTSGTVTTKDGTRLFVKSWGVGPTIVFSHAWPLSADAWDGQMGALADAGYRVIAHDRRSHGRSDQSWAGNDLDQHADDLADVLQAFDVRDATLVGHSAGANEVVRYIGRHGGSRVARVMLVSAIAGAGFDSAASSGSIQFFSSSAGAHTNRAQHYRNLAAPFLGYDGPGAPVPLGAVEEFWRQGMMGCANGQSACLSQISHSEILRDVRQLAMPTLIVHGEDDQIVPVDRAFALSREVAGSARVKVYQGAPHGLPMTHGDQLNADLLTFLRG